jgi:hypothetical protein
MAKHTARHNKKVAERPHATHRAKRPRVTRPAPPKEVAPEGPTIDFAVIERESPQTFEFVERVEFGARPQEVEVVEVQDWF